MAKEQCGCRRGRRRSERESKKRLKCQEKKKDIYEEGEVSQRKVLQRGCESERKITSSTWQHVCEARTVVGTSVLDVDRRESQGSHEGPNNWGGGWG